MDTWLVYKIATGSSESQPEFYTLLAEELIDNTSNQGCLGLQQNCSTANATSPEVANQRTDAGRSGVQVHLTNTKKKWKNRMLAYQFCGYTTQNQVKCIFQNM